MKNEVVEVGIPLDKDLMFYHEMLLKSGWRLAYFCFTHDLYYSKNVAFEGMTERQIKDSCIRLRVSVTNTDHLNDEMKKAQNKALKLEKEGYLKAFDTEKFDFHYAKDGVPSRIQLQDIKEIGLLVYYDNINYIEFPPEKQREMLMQELCECGFDFSPSALGLDKLRTLYYGKKMYSCNQNA